MQLSPLHALSRLRVLCWGRRDCAGWSPAFRADGSSCSFHPAQDQERRTPLHAAAYIGDVAILELLILSGKGQGSGALLSTGAAFRESFRSLLCSEVQSSRGCSPSKQPCARN